MKDIKIYFMSMKCENRLINNILITIFKNYLYQLNFLINGVQCVYTRKRCIIQYITCGIILLLISRNCTLLNYTIYTLQSAYYIIMYSNYCLPLRT